MWEEKLVKVSCRMWPLSLSLRPGNIWVCKAGKEGIASGKVVQVQVWKEQGTGPKRGKGSSFSSWLLLAFLFSNFIYRYIHEIQAPVS